MSRGNPTPPTTTMPWGIPLINPVSNMIGMGLGISNQYFGNLPPKGGNPHWNTYQVQGQYLWSGQIPGNYQLCWSPHPQGRN